MALRLGAVSALMLQMSGVLSHQAFAGEGTSLQSIAEREIQRRQQLVTQAEGRIGEAVKLGQDGKNEEAAKLMLAAYETLPNSPSAAGVKARVRGVFADASCAWAQSLLAQGRQKEALEVLDAVLDEDMDPHNARALRLKEHANDPDRFPPALTPGHIARTEQVKTLLIQAGSALDLGDYDKANSIYADVIRLDPYNVAARRGMERVEHFKSEYHDAARDHLRAKQLGSVNSLWEDGVPPRADVTAMFASSGGGGSVTRNARDNLQKMLQTLRVPRAEFNGASLDETVEYLRVSSRNVDPAGRGVSFVVSVDAATREKTITLNLQDVPLEELVRYITQMTGTAYRVEDNAVVITSMSERSTSLITKTYRVPPDFIQTAEVNASPAASDPFAAGQGAAAQQGLKLRRMGAKEFLESRGVVFPEGGGASFSPASSMLIVRTNPDNINLVDLLVEQSLGAAPKQVKVSVRMIDISQTNLNELGFDWLLGQSNMPGSSRVFASGGTVGNQGDPAKFDAGSNGIVTAGLRSSGALFGVSSLDNELANSKASGGAPTADSRSPTQFALTGVLTDPQFQVALRAIQQKKGVDLVSVPSIVAKAGQKSSIRVIREFPYPTEFDPPQIPQQVGQVSAIARGGLLGGTTTNANTSGPVTPTTPTAFEKKELGVVLEIEPVVSADGKTVEVALSPSNTEFEGFIDYGSDISNAIDNVNFDPVLFAFVTATGARYTQPNNILQPVFRKSTVTTAVNIYDGSTVVLGGVISERVGNIEDKVPFVGNIPLVGRLWQSKVKETQQRCVLFFVTVDVIDPSGQKVNQATAAAR